MKKLNDIPRAWGDLDPDDVDWESGKDKLIERLENEGHKTISVERSVVVIEQCEEDDAFPAGWSSDPLRISIYPDPDAGFNNSPDYLYVHAGRSGLMDIFLSTEITNVYQTFRLMSVDKEASEPSLSQSGATDRARSLARLAQKYLSGYYWVRVGENAGVEHSEELKALGKDAKEAIERYIAKLETFPNLFRGWDREVE